MDDNNQFIEIRRVLSDPKTKINTSSQPEVIRISLIETFRPWHKGKKDMAIDGKMTVLVLTDKNRELDLMLEHEEKKARDPEEVEDGEEKKRKSPVRTMLIQEDFDSFLYRMSIKTSIKKLSDGPGSNLL